MATGIDSLRFDFKVQAISNDFNGMVRCTTYSRTESGNYYDYSRTTAYKWSGSAAYQWSLYLTNRRVDAAKYGYYFARCTVPGKKVVNGRTIRSGILNMRSWEIY